MRICTHPLDWNDLRYFLAVARSGTLTGAGRALGVEHTTVSRRLGALETALGARLFTRGPDGWTLTEAGARILPNVEGMGARAESIERSVKGGDAKVEGSVRLTIPGAMQDYMMATLPALRAEHPALVIELLCDNRDLDIRRGEADVAVRFSSVVADPELVSKKLGTAGWALYAASSYVERKGALTSLDTLAGHDLIGSDVGMGVTFFRERGAGATVVLRGNELSMVQSAARAGLGIVALPCMLGDEDEGLVRAYPEPFGTRDITLLVHPDLVRTARVRAAMDFLIGLFECDQKRWSGVR